VSYVASRGESGELNAIRAYAETIDEFARRIEDSITPEPLTKTSDSSLAA
jgi:hypothetical protein